jgi:hypothetical protein
MNGRRCGGRMGAGWRGNENCRTHGIRPLESRAAEARGEYVEWMSNGYVCMGEIRLTGEG